jgi:hypothetical protein
LGSLSLLKCVLVLLASYSASRHEHHRNVAYNVELPHSKIVGLTLCMTPYTGLHAMRARTALEPQQLTNFIKDPQSFLATANGMQGRILNSPLLAPSHHAHKLTTGSSLRSPPQALSTSVSFKVRKPLLQHSCQRVRAASQPDASATSTNSVTSLSDAPLQPVSGELGALPTTAGVYAVYDTEQKLQYIGLSRKVTSRCLRHAQHSGMNRL